MRKMKSLRGLQITIGIGFLFGLFMYGCSASDDSSALSADGDADWEGDVDNSISIDGNPDEPISEGDQYEGVGTNPFVIAEHDPFSTFAADVDSASYDIFRRDVNYGYLPQPDSVRLEEYVNYFSYEYPIPSGEQEHPFTVALDGGPSLTNPHTSILRVGIQGKMPSDTEKKPANIVYLIDTSGSMTSGEKLPLVKQVLNDTLNVLDPGDTVAVVSYAGGTEVKLPPTDVSESESIQSVISGLSGGGSTAGASGINLAYAQAEAAFIEDGINHVILCTDGDFNVGPSTDEALVSLIEEKRKSGITLTVLGFGIGNLNDSMMEKVSNAGNGIYAVISSSKHASDFVENRMLSTLEIIAKDMKIQVEFNPLFVKAYRLLGYENRDIADDDFTDDTVDAGEVGAGHSVTALYELVFPDGAIPLGDGISLDDGAAVGGLREVDEEQMVLVKVRYKTPDAGEDDEAFEIRTQLQSKSMAVLLDTTSDGFKWAVAVAAFAEIIKESPYASTDALPQINQIVTSDNWLDGDRSEFSSLFSQAYQMLIQE